MGLRVIRFCVVGALAASPVEAQLAPPSGSAPGIVPSVAPPTASEVTEGNQLVTCEVESVDGTRHTFAFQYFGRRGYIDPRTHEAATTDGRVSVGQDRSRLLSSYSRWAKVGHSFEAHSDDKNAALGPRLRLEMHRTNFDPEAMSERQAVLVQAHLGWMPLTKAAGFCDVRWSAQQPLSEAETRAHLNL